MLGHTSDTICYELFYREGVANIIHVICESGRYRTQGRSCGGITVEVITWPVQHRKSLIHHTIV
jgi:hypothetical protein